MSGPRPCGAAEAVQRALQYVGKARYLLSGGGYKLDEPDAPPWRAKYDKKTKTTIQTALDCSGFVTWCYRLPRNRPGFNKGHWARVSDDLNTDSIADDGERHRELFTKVDTPQVGDLIVYPGLWMGGDRKSIGHVGLVSGVPAEWDPAAPQYELLQVTHCSPSDPKKKWPTGIKTTNGGIWRDRQGKAKTRLVRVVP